MPRGKGKKALYEKYEKCEAVQTALRKAKRFAPLHISHIFRRELFFLYL